MTRDDAEALELIRHDAAHIMAEAVQELYPGTQVTIGPVIENGFYYDFYREESFTPEDLEKIEAKMRAIVAADKPFTKEVWSRAKAREFFADQGEGFKVELVDAIPEDQDVNIYSQGEWFDLCRGPHLPSTGKIGTAFKLMRLAGPTGAAIPSASSCSASTAPPGPQRSSSTPIFISLKRPKSATTAAWAARWTCSTCKKRRRARCSGIPKGWTLFRALIDYMRRRQEANGYVEVNSPDMMERKLWEQSGHWEKFGENMFVTETPDERVFCCKPMNCPGHIQIFKNGLKSYRDLPLRIAEFGKVHRYEPSGALHGIMRVRHFTQDDAHIFCTQDQMIDECINMHNMILSIYHDFGFEDVLIKLSTRPEKRVGSDEVWDLAEAALKAALEKTGLPYVLSPGEGAFYGPKLEYTLRDAIGREWQCGTIQLDFNLPVRLGAFYIGEDGAKHPPVMIHRAMFGSIERFVGILIENYAGHLPLWLSPVQAMVATIVSDADKDAGKVLAACEKAGLRADVDLRNEKINYKVREHSMAKVPVTLVVGKREAEEKTVSIRRLGSQAQETLPLADALRRIAAEAVPPDLAPKTPARQKDA